MPIPQEKDCPLCGGAPRFCAYEIDRDMFAVECPVCGKFKISDLALPPLSQGKKALLSAYCRRARKRSHFVEIFSDNIDQLIDTLPKFSPPEKLDNLLQLMGEKTPALGEFTQFDSARDYPLLIASGQAEIEYFIETLLNRGYLDGDLTGLKLTMAGWERLEEIRKKSTSSTRCFVAMWFDNSMTEIYDNAIAPAVQRAGYEPLRIDLHEHVNRIDDEIIGQIKRSRFMVADFTGQRHGVYFEAGLMLGLGRTVIWMANKTELSKENGLHFDVRQFNFIAYDSVADAKKRLYHRILAIEGEGSIPNLGHLIDS